MEDGHIVAQPPMNNAPATIGWLEGSVVPSGRGIMDQMNAFPLVQVGLFAWSPIPRFPARRCTACKLVEFSYGDAILKAPGEDEVPVSAEGGPGPA